MDDYSSEIVLVEGNYSTWVISTSAVLRIRGLFNYATKTTIRPSTTDEQEVYDDEIAKAAAIIIGSLDASQFEHIAGHHDNPKAMWDALAAHHVPQTPQARFAALHKLIYARKEPNESLSEANNRIAWYGHELLDNCPSTFTAKDLVNELIVHVSIHCLPEDEFGAFKSLVLVHGTLTRENTATMFRNQDMIRAMSAAKRQPTGQGGKSNTIPFCPHCRHHRHLPAQCWVLHPNLKPSRRGKTNSSSSQGPYLV